MSAESPNGKCGELRADELLTTPLHRNPPPSVDGELYAWREYLASLLNLAERAAARGDGEWRDCVRVALVGFLRVSPSIASELDRMANLALDALHAGPVGEMVRLLRERRADLADFRAG